MKQTAKIRDWEIVPTLNGQFQLVGEILEHPDKPKFQTGRQITSILKYIDFDKKSAETLNTIYELVD
jgi:hypothetical protein